MHISENENSKRHNQKSNLKSKSKKNSYNKEDYLNIWKVNPSFKDFNFKNSVTKIIFLTSFFILFTILTYIFYNNAIISITYGLFLLICFIIVFYDCFFTLRDLSFNLGNSIKKKNPFEDFKFFFLEGNNKVIFCTNKKDLRTIAISFFKIYTIPEAIHPTGSSFFDSLNKAKIPYTFQVMQSPMINISDEVGSELKRHHHSATKSSLKITIYLSTFYDITGVLNKSKLNTLLGKVDEYADAIMDPSIATSLYHFKVGRLSGGDIIKALRSCVFHLELDKDSNNINYLNVEKFTSKNIIRLLFIGFIISYLSFVLFLFKIALLNIIIIDCVFLSIILYIWWRELFSLLNITLLKKDAKIIATDPFRDIQFFGINAFPDSIFIYTQCNLLINIKMFNLKYARVKFHEQKKFYKADEFYRALIKKKVPFCYTITGTPILFYNFYKNKQATNFLIDYHKDKVLNQFHGFQNELEAEDWMNMRLGLFNSILTISVYSFKRIEHLKNQDIHDLEQKSNRSALIMKHAYQDNFNNFILEPLLKRKLISGIIFESVKNKFFRISGSYLNYLIFQGKTLLELSKVENMLKKGVETAPPAEFNTPLYLENSITFGHAINTEFLDKEVEAGFLLKQVKNLLVTNGTIQNRQRFLMKIASELLKINQPSIIFDFYGDWSKLIKYFESSRFSNHFLYFKYINSFKTNPLRTEYFTEDNIDYLRYIFELYGLIFKKTEKEISYFRNTILRNPEIGFQQLNLELKNQPTWNRMAENDNLISFFDGISDQEFEFYIGTHSMDNNDNITIKDFISDNKTVILDFSNISDYKMRLFFAFVILSKIIHYCSHSSNFTPKILVIPGSDIIFNADYLDKNMDHNKIDMFLYPLIKEGFGFIFEANQIRYVHNNLFNYFDNIITFKTTDTRDIAVLKSQINLQEDYGIGYYSNTRHNTYQIQYLMKLKEDEAIMKRSDIPQPFPVLINNDIYNNVPIMETEEINNFMKNQGYDLISTEKKLKNLNNKTLFEFHLGPKVYYLKEVMLFLEAQKKVENIALYKNDLQKQLLQSIYQKIRKKTNNKREIVKIRDEIFNLLLKHGYLVEHHPDEANGNQSIGMAFRVGEQYEKSLEDYFKKKNNEDISKKIEILEMETNKSNKLKKLFNDPQQQNNERELFKDLLAHSLGILYYNLFQIYKNINRSEHDLVIEGFKNFILKFFSELYKNQHNINYALTEKDIMEYITFLCQKSYFPFKEDEIFSLIKESNSLDSSKNDIQSQLESIYQKLDGFFKKIQDITVEE